MEDCEEWKAITRAITKTTLWDYGRHVQSYTLAQGGSRLRADANPPARATPVRDGAEKFEATLIKPQALNPLNPKP